MENEKERFSPFKICVRYAANLTGDEKLSCEYKYCTARLEDSSLNKVCKPSRDRLSSMTKQYTNFNDKQKVINNFIELCPHSNIIDSPFR